MRLRSQRRATRRRTERAGDVHLSEPGSLLRAALEAAIDEARAGLGADPPQLPPSGLRPYIGFAKRGARALAAVRAVVDDDEDFRVRVAATVTDDEVGRAGWLWLHRPDGWAAELADLEDADARRTADAAEARADRGAARKLGAARDAAAKADAAAIAARKEAAKAREALAVERRRRSEAEAEVARLTAERAGAIRQVKELEERGAQRTAEVRALTDQIRLLQDEAGRDQTAPELDQAALATDLAAAAAAAAALATDLARVHARVVPTESAPERTGSGRPATRAKRRPVALPGGMLDDGPEAVAWLVRQPGAVLVVDGYNVTKAQWPDLSALEQRDRLVDALRQMATRSGAHVEVVFDGAAGVSPAGRGVGRDPVRVRFSDHDVEADDDIIALVRELAARIPVIVASSDNRVRAGASAGGANLVHSRQLLAALRR